MANKKRSLLARLFFGSFSAILYVLSIPSVRNWIWNKLLNKGKQKVGSGKVIDVEGTEVRGERK